MNAAKPFFLTGQEPQRRLLTGWGGTAPTAATVVEPESPGELERLVRSLADGRSGASPALLPRGLGRSYGDAAQMAGGVVVDLTRLDRILGFDPVTGVVDVEAGVSLDRLLRVFVPQGWFVPVTPGTRFVTVGGAIACDIHGKNHHVSGAFGQHVHSLELLTASGEIRTLTPDATPAEFWATVSGMGLTGIVLRACLQLVPIETSVVRVDTLRLPDLDTLLEVLRTTDNQYQYSVAWVDMLATGAALGRSVVTRGDHASVEHLGDRADDPLAYDPRARLGAPGWIPPGLLNRLSVRAFNELWFRKAPRQRSGELQSIAAFFHPLDGVRNWNRIYGRPGFVQWQCAVPDGSEQALRGVFARCAAAGTASFLAVLKRFGAADPAPLSFPTTGWTLALDIPTGLHGLGELLDGLDRLVVDVGGRLYLTKDARTRADLVPLMYPRLDEWREVRERLDPQRRFDSDLARRLAL